jgi:hypothetical protein
MTVTGGIGTLEAGSVRSQARRGIISGYFTEAFPELPQLFT